MKDKDKNLNALDGSSVLEEVVAERIEAQRKSYKTAVKSAVVRYENAQASADKATARADKNKGKLDTLVEGGLEGFLAKDEEIVDEEENGGITRSSRAFKRPYSYHLSNADGL